MWQRSSNILLQYLNDCTHKPTDSHIGGAWHLQENIDHMRVGLEGNHVEAGVSGGLLPTCRYETSLVAQRVCVVVGDHEQH